MSPGRTAMDRYHPWLKYSALFIIGFLVSLSNQLPVEGPFIIVGRQPSPTAEQVGGGVVWAGNYKRTGTSYYSFEIPIAWEARSKQIMDDPPGSRPYARDMVLPISGRSPCEVGFFVKANYKAEGMTPEGILDREMENLKRPNSPFRLVRRNPAKVGGQPAWEYEVEYQVDIPDARQTCWQLGLLVKDPRQRDVYYNLHLKTWYTEGAMRRPGQTPSQLSKEPSPNCRGQIESHRAIFNHIKQTFRF